MQRAHNGEEQERGSRQIAGKEDGKGRVTHHQHRLAWKRVDQIAAERSEQERRQRVTRQHQSYDVLRGAEMLFQIERQQRCEDVKSEKQRKIGCHHLTIVSVPKSVF